MGFVSVVALAAGIAFLVSLQRHMNRLADEEQDRDVSWWIRWGARASAVLALLGALGVVDAYLYDLPTPFEPPEAELPPRHVPDPRDADLPDIEQAEKPDPMRDSRERHRDALDDFERRGSR